MENKKDLSNLLSKKEDHNIKKHHNRNQPQYNINRNLNQNEEGKTPNNLQKKAVSIFLQAEGVPKELADKISQDDRVYDLANKANDKIPGVIKNPLSIKIKFIAIILIIIAVILMSMSIILFSDEQSMKQKKIGFGGMYNIRCNEMTVIFVDKNNGYEVTGTETYSLTDYVAGVVAAEVGGLSNKELYKTYALAARTFGLKHADEDCTIEGSSRRQAFRDITDSTDESSKLIYEAVQETEGQVLISNNELFSVTYDAFCYAEKDSNYYTLSQKEQKIPTDWVESNIGNYYYKNCPCNANDESMTDCWSDKGSWRDGGHGSGMSQYGAYYLATELEYTYDEILDYYYGDSGVTISTNSFIESIAGLEIKDTTKAKYLQQPITEFLNSNGSSLENLNAFIYDSVVNQGAGTRAGVVTAAVSMINYLYDNFNTRLPYYWGGNSKTIGLPSSFGTYSPSAVSRGGNVNYYKSFDCSGFVSWAIKNGGYNFNRLTTTGFDSEFSKNSCNIKDTNCVGQPGDLINSRNGHVELIIAVDQENGKYFIAHSGGPGVVMMERNMHAGNSDNTVTKILFMEEFYNNPLNINPSY